MSRLLDAQFPPSDVYEIRPGADPESVRNILLALYEMRVRIRHIRAEYERDEEPLKDRLAAARIERDLDQGIANARAFLTDVAYRGGRGFPPKTKPAASEQANGAPATVALPMVEGAR